MESRPHIEEKITFKKYQDIFKIFAQQNNTSKRENVNKHSNMDGRKFQRPKLKTKYNMVIRNVDSRRNSFHQEILCKLFIQWEEVGLKS